MATPYLVELPIPWDLIERHVLDRKLATFGHRTATGSREHGVGQSYGRRKRGT